jgi:GT2 family glycosyltransferase
MFSIIIPTLNNLDYLKLCISSLKKNSKFENEIIPHVNIGSDGTFDYLNKKNIDFTHTEHNAGICEGVNLGVQKAKFKYVIYAHDDFYFCPEWDLILEKEIKKIGHKDFYLSGTMMNGDLRNGQIKFDCGSNNKNFDESKFLNEYKKHNYYDYQGSTWAPHVLHIDTWNMVGGFSEEFYPGTGSDPDLNMKLWKKGVRIFKGINDFKVYHFGSIVTRKYSKDSKIKTETGNLGSKIFLIKWGISISFFKKFILQSDTYFKGPLPTKTPYNISYFINLIKCKINYIYVKYIYNFKKKIKLSNENS